MKTFTTTMGRLSALLLLLFVSTNLFAQVFRVYTKDGQHQEYAAENVDSIVFFTQPSDEPSDNPDPVLPDMHEAVDLGLPSGLKWATCNVGASSPEEYGGYYAWGETEEKSDYGWDTYKWCKGSSSSMTKYCTDSYFGTVDGKTLLEPSDDVAHVKWGGSWRMPTFDEMNELHTNCTWTWTSQNGVNGQLVTGPNGNSIFLPAAGDRYGTDFDGRGSYGIYWSATLSGYFSFNACYLDFDDGDHDWNGNCRYFGHSVRPVTDELLSGSEK